MSGGFYGSLSPALVAHLYVAMGVYRLSLVAQDVEIPPEFDDFHAFVTQLRSVSERPGVSGSESTEDALAVAMVRPDELLTHVQAGRELGVHAKTVAAWLRSGKLRGTSVNERSERVSRREIDRLAAEAHA